MKKFGAHKTLLGVLIGVVLYELYDRKVATPSGTQGPPKLS